MSLRREVLDGLTCAHSDHTAEACNNNVLYLHSACHIDVPTWAAYDKTTGDLTIRCAACDAHVATIRVAWAGRECPRCHGSGEIGFNNSPNNDPQQAQEATCNLCHGEGVLDADVIDDPYEGD